MNLCIQRLEDALNADRVTVKVTAEAVEKADEVRRNAADSSWNPWQKSFAVIAAVGGLVAMYFALKG